MAENYTVDGVTASLAPFSVQWQNVTIGTDHNGAPIHSLNKQVVLSFSPGSPTYARQWLDTVDGGSHTFDVLDERQLGYVTLSPIYVSTDDFPAIEDINVNGFTITLLRARS